MDFLDNAISKTKEAFDIAYKKTEEAVGIGKQKFNIASLENEISRDYKKLGQISYKIALDSEISNKQVKELVDSITEKLAKIKDLENEINKKKNKKVCKNCNALIDERSIYCNVCGEKTV